MRVYVHVNLLYFNEFEIFIYDFIKIRCKTTRNAISNDQKREICQYKKDNPKVKNVEFISHFEKKLNRQFGRSTLTEILQNSTL